MSFAGLDLPEQPGAPVTVRLVRVDEAGHGEIETVRARFVVGCDGARSQVRKALGRSLTGEFANQAWGVMDVLAVTDFPDIRLKTAIHSADEGSLLIIPREGGYLVRMYIELDKLGEQERIADRAITIERLIAAAGRILRPYTLEVKEVAWWSVYEIGQRLCDKFDDVAYGMDRVPSVFIAGDACHTHSPKAGQGMNVSMQDGFNLGWKLAAVLEGRSDPAILHSYSAERQAVAAELIEFDREFATMFSATPKRAGVDGGIDPAEFQRYFVQQGRFTAGVATRYAPSLISAEPRHQALAQGFPIGMRLHSAPVIRMADAKPVQLGHVGGADGRWRILLFTGARDTMGSLHALCSFLTAPGSGPCLRFTPPQADIDSVIDVRAILQDRHQHVRFEALPDLLRPRKGRFSLVDYEKVFCPDFGAGDIFDTRDIDRQSGCAVVVRPDQYVSHILPLDAHAALSAFFSAFMLDQSNSNGPRYIIEGGG